MKKGPEEALRISGFVTEGTLGSTLRALFDPLPDKTLFVKVSGRLRYGQVVQAMDVAHSAGVERIGLRPHERAPD